MIYTAVNNIVHFREVDTTLSEKVISKEKYPISRNYLLIER